MSRITSGAEDSLAYYCGWAITGQDAISHMVSAARFPLAGSQHRAWCGQLITVIGLTLNSRHAPRSCPDCNRYLRALSSPPC